MGTNCNKFEICFQLRNTTALIFLFPVYHNNKKGAEFPTTNQKTQLQAPQRGTTILYKNVGLKFTIARCIMYLSI